MSHTHIEHHQPAQGVKHIKPSKEFLPVLENRHSMAFLHVISGHHECIRVCFYDFTAESLDISEKSSFCLRIRAHALQKTSFTVEKGTMDYIWHIYTDIVIKVKVQTISCPKSSISIGYYLWVVFSPIGFDIPISLPPPKTNIAFPCQFFLCLCVSFILPETNSSPLKIGLAPKWKDRLPTIHFQVFLSDLQKLIRSKKDCWSLHNLQQHLLHQLLEL